MTAVNVFDPHLNLEQILEKRIIAQREQHGLIDIKCLFTRGDDFSTPAAAFQVANALGKIRIQESMNLDELTF